MLSQMWYSKAAVNRKQKMSHTTHIKREREIPIEACQKLTCKQFRVFNRSISNQTSRSARSWWSERPRGANSLTSPAVNLLRGEHIPPCFILQHHFSCVDFEHGTGLLIYEWGDWTLRLMTSDERSIPLRSIPWNATRLPSTFHQSFIIGVSDTAAGGQNKWRPLSHQRAV